MGFAVSQTGKAAPVLKPVLNRLTPSQVPWLRRRKKHLHQIADAQPPAKQVAEYPTLHAGPLRPFWRNAP